MKIIFCAVFCALANSIAAQNYLNATHLARGGRKVPTDLAGYVEICNNNAGLVICNSNGDYTALDSNGNQVTDTICDATGTIYCRVPGDPRPLQFCTGMTPYCVQPLNGPATCSSVPQVLSSVAPVSTCPVKAAFECTDVGDFPDVEDCRRFWRCELKTTIPNAFKFYDIRPTSIFCPPATVFDPTIESRCRYVGVNQANNNTLCINIRSLCSANSDQIIPLNYPWLLSGRGQYVATCQGPLKPYVTFCPPGYDPNYSAMPASCNVNCRNPYAKIRAYQDPTKYYICIPTNNVGSYMPVIQSCPPYQTFDQTTEKCQLFFGDFVNLVG